MRTTLWLATLVAGASATLLAGGGAGAQMLITGNDEKVSFDANTGKTIMHPAGKDTVSIIDIADPAKPKIVANLPLMNTITGPPVNLAITPDQHLALVANSLDWVKDGDSWKGVPDNKIYVIDLTASPPAQIGTVDAGKQASGMAINRAGTLALVANRAEDIGHRAGDRRQERKTCGHGIGCYQADSDGRGAAAGAAGRRRDHPRRQARARRQERRQPSGAARHRRPKG